MATYVRITRYSIYLLFPIKLTFNFLQVICADISTNKVKIRAFGVELLNMNASQKVLQVFRGVDI